MIARALIYCENEFGKIDGKVANGLARHSEKYDILGVIDSTKTGLDTGEYLDGIKNGIPVFPSINDAIEKLGFVPEYFIYGIAAQAAYLDQEQREVILAAMKTGMNFVNGFPEFFTEDEEFIRKAIEYRVHIYDMRKAPQRTYLHNFSGRILEVTTPVIAVLGTDCAVGKRTTAVCLVDALKQVGLNPVFIATGQTGLLQGAKYGIAVDVLTSGFATGLCIENSPYGRELFKSLKEIIVIDPEYIQFCCAEWFWKREVNSYALQVEPDRFKHKDTAIIDLKEALHIEKTRNKFFLRLYEFLENELKF